MLRRRAMMAAADGGGDTPLIPDDYQRVEYIESLSTTQTGPLFDTGYRANRTGDLVVEIDCMPVGNVAAAQFAIGCASSGSNTGFAIGFGSAGNTAYAFNGSSTIIQLLESGNVNGHRYYLKATTNPEGFVRIECGDIYEEAMTTDPRAYGSASGSRFSLFGAKKATTNQLNTPFKGRIYFAKITENGVLKRELYPCYRKSDNAPGFFDVVNQTFQGRLGGSTAEISLGPEVN